MSDDFIRVTYRIECAGDPAAMAAKIASDQSTGTFTELPGETEDVRHRCAARVEDVRTLPPVERPSFPQTDGVGPFNRTDAVIAYPLDAVGTDFAALMTITVGGVYSARGLSGIRVMDFDLPPVYAEHPGPQFGIDGSRRLTGVTEGPIIASIIKPSLGLTPEETAKVIAELCAAGVDFIKDDEKLMSPAYSPLSARIDAIMPVIRDHEQRTGKRVMYAFGISSADPDTMMRNHDMVVEAGGNAAVININSIGYGGMSFLRKRSALCLHAHRNGWDILTRHPGLGMEFRAYQKIWRLLGVDQFQINGIRAKYWEPDESFVRSFQDCMTPIFSDADRPLPVVCSGQWGGQAVDTYAYTGRTLDLMYLAGGGIHGHPMGPAAGVRAIRQAWDAAAAGETLDDAARTHPELAASLAKFGGKKNAPPAARLARGGAKDQPCCAVTVLRRENP
ncbi:3-oxo-isoapionate-4-phosphate decarboxylase OiaX [Paracoccus sp. SCSIO 75233]|uniref:3-oxo-isoapionate-4-phosphate decarboxylase OiaX n=1 Tax=Paracoccus sp. SCSIO 75233 TaxID=3017782 RepID=UPI0022F126BD|nr:3-oxo-isoapionate-4-phosphate decarboxylase OiaX [Paracoccus sp. SCSIO 75233]WBU52640.1 ribulose-bisphosphate carboxylase large subunit family protein [Paracoccus sp. SCSIO 75233]